MYDIQQTADTLGLRGLPKIDLLEDVVPSARRQMFY
jgi:hypothetical protein